MKIRNVSASQVELFERCNRWWWWERVAGHRLPPSPAMLRGSGIHESIEYYLLHNQIVDNEWKKFVVAAQSHLPAPDENVFVELKISLDTGYAGIPWIGFIDLLEYERRPMRVRDYKTTSDFRYAKTPVELSCNTQLISYARFCYEQGHVGPIELAHLYLHTRRKTPTTKCVDTIVDETHINAEWDKRLLVVGDMITAADIEAGEDISPNPGSCGMYGGCPHRARCGISDTNSPLKRIGLAQGKRKKKENSMSFLDKLKEANAKKGAANKTNGQTAPPAPVATAPATTEASTEAAPLIPDGIVPPDAPPRTTDQKEADRIKAEAEARGNATTPPKSTRGRKKMTPAQKAAKKAERAKAALAEAESEATALAEAEMASEPEAPQAPEMPSQAPQAASAASATPQAPQAATALQGLTLYVDCLPTKPTGGDYTLFEDWFMGIATQIAEAAEVVDYRLLPYAEEKAALTQAIITAHDANNLPSVMVVNTGSMGAKDALSVLTPYALNVVRAMR